MPEKGIQRQADHRLTRNRPKLLGEVPSSPLAAPCRHDHGCNTIAHKPFAPLALALPHVGPLANACCPNGLNLSGAKTYRYCSAALASKPNLAKLYATCRRRLIRVHNIAISHLPLRILPKPMAAHRFYCWLDQDRRADRLS